MMGQRPIKLPDSFARPLGHVEKMFQAGHTYGQWVVCYVFFLSTNFKLDALTIKHCMRKLAAKHAMLRSCIAKHNDGTLYWKESENDWIDYREVATDDWLRRYTQSLSERFDERKGPLWRVTYMPKVKEYADESLSHHSALVFDFHHSIANGQGESFWSLSLRHGCLFSFKIYPFSFFTVTNASHFSNPTFYLHTDYLCMFYAIYA